ncbi:replication initiation protein [Zooshikella sp. RANM57]|uniref:replication initiation protein n=1 Tax=Zooshikella sp. RANM57 TaxID=3425863 RepID=UPI003D6E72DF
MGTFKMDRKTKELVIKRNELIEGRYKLSAMSQKVAAVLISRVNPHDSILPQFVITREEAIAELGIAESQYRRYMKKITTELAHIVIILDEEKEETTINMFLKSVYDKPTGKVTFEFHPEIEPYIRDFQRNFTQYQLQQIRELNSKYSIRLYEILRRYHPLRCSRPVSYYQVSIEELRGMLGVEEDKYTTISNFKSRVITYAKKELEKKTDLKFTDEYIRWGRKIGAIKFCISHNEHFEAVEGDETLIPEVLPDSYDEAIALILSSTVPELDENFVKLLASKLDAVAASQACLSFKKAQNKGEIKDPAAYFLKILESQKAGQEAGQSSYDDMDTGWADKHKWGTGEG